MADKKAFVFDTNFIIQIQKLDSVIEDLKDGYTVYVSQVSIDERIAQQCRELKNQYEAVEAAKVEYKRIATVQITRSYEKDSDLLSAAIQKRYSSTFGENIIPFAKDGSTFGKIIDRANQKTPPFSSDKNASDKGFKDCLLWLSLLSFFKDHGESEVVFSTDDQAFLKNDKFLVDEFLKATGKKIEIKQNSYYKELTKQPVEEEPPAPAAPPTPPIDLNSLRDQISNAIGALCTVVEENFFGDINWLRAFTASKKFDKESMNIVFENMNDVLQAHLLDRSIPASLLLGADHGVVDDDSEIPTTDVEKAVRLYQSIKTDYPEYYEQFLEASAKVLNRNYKAPKIVVSDDDLPF